MTGKWLRIFGYPPVIAVSFYVFHGETIQHGWGSMLHGLMITTIFTISIWEGNHLIFRWASNRFPEFSQTMARMLVSALLSVAYTVLIQVVLEAILFYSLNLHPSGAPPIDWMACIVTSLFPLGLMLAVYEGVFFFEKWKDSIRQQEKMALAQVQSQFEALKKQLDPHFLFNSLNTLAYLIDLENEPAQEYLSRLSDVYRYVLETRDRTTVKLEDELGFLEDYLYLNQVRFQDHVQLEQELSPAVKERRLPALSLQLLVENALKHNVISAEQPLSIRIKEEDGQLWIENNKQMKQGKVPSTRLGLANLQEQYRLLTSQAIEIIDEPKRFAVRLPLLEPAA
ncbi:MAG: histidine kinase [Bacteroidota bacterium]